jgi:two-component system, response regulator YesN
MALRILIVENEPLERVHLKTMVDWEAHGYLLVGEAANGREAIRLIGELRADIVITDVRMPVVDGLELIAASAGREDRPEFLILSGFDDYGLVRRGLTLGAYDYLLKLDMDARSLLEALAGMRTRIESRSLDRRPRGDAPEASPRAARKRLIDDIVKGTPHDEEEYRRVMEQLGLAPPGAEAFCAAIRVGEAYLFEDPFSRETERLSGSILSIAEEIAREDFFADCFEGKPGEFLLFASPRRGEGGGLECFRRTVERLVDMLELYLNVHAKAGLGTSGGEPQGMVVACARASEAIKGRFYFENLKVVPWSPDPYPERRSEGHSAIRMGKSLSRALDSRRKDLLDEFFARFCAEVCRPELSSSAIKRCLFELDFMVREYFEENQPDPEAFLASSKTSYEEIQAMDDIGEAKRWIRSLAGDLLRFIGEEEGAECSRVVSLAKKHVVEHFAEDLSLGGVAASVRLSPSYFSAKFKRHAGMCFSEYLNQVRVEAAKRMLLEGLSMVYEVAERCGYRDSYYFNRVFKRITGLSPGSFRERGR